MKLQVAQNVSDTLHSNSNGDGIAFCCVFGLCMYVWSDATSIVHNHSENCTTRPLHNLFSLLNNQYDQSALYIAAEGGHKDTVKLLLDEGANTEATDKVCHYVNILQMRRYASNANANQVTLIALYEINADIDSL